MAEDAPASQQSPATMLIFNSNIMAGELVLIEQLAIRIFPRANLCYSLFIDSDTDVLKLDLGALAVILKGDPSLGGGVFLIMVS